MYLNNANHLKVIIITILIFWKLSEWDEENVILTGSMDGVVRVSGGLLSSECVLLTINVD